MDETKGCTVINNQYYGCCKSDGGCILDNGCNSSNTGNDTNNTYSFNEIEIGTWVDGKTIYRKVIEGETAAASGNHLLFADVATLKVDNLINVYGHIIARTKEQIQIQTTHTNTSNGTSVIMSIYYEPNSKTLKYYFVDGAGSWSAATVYVTIEYTKQDITVTA